MSDYDQSARSYILIEQVVDLCENVCICDIPTRLLLIHRPCSSTYQ